jgi:hypothetical protein
LVFLASPTSHQASDADQRVAGEDRRPQQPVPNHERVRREVVIAYQVVQRGPLAQVPVDLDPAVRPAGHQRRQLPQPADAEVGHERAERGPLVQVLAAQLADVRAGRHDVEEELLTLGVHDPDDLQRERVERHRIVPAVGRGQRDRGRRPGPDRPDVLRQLPSLPDKLGKQPGIARRLRPDLTPQLRKLLRKNQSEATTRRFRCSPWATNSNQPRFMLIRTCRLRNRQALPVRANTRHAAS